MKPLKANWKRWPFALLGIALSAAPAVAHEKWFVNEFTYHGPIPELFRQPTFFGVVALAIGAALFLLALAVDRHFDGIKIRRKVDEWFSTKRLQPKVFLGVTLGVSLMGAGLQHLLFTPSLHLDTDGAGAVLALIETFVGVAFVFLEPFYAELGVALILLWLAGFAMGITTENMLEELMMVGIGIYFITGETERLPWAKWNNEEIRRRGYQALRILVGLNFLVLASVKFIRPDLALFLVDQHEINFASFVGFSNAQFVFVAGIVETLIALCILFRAAFRLASFVAFNFFLITIYVFGFGELLGHLPIKATLLLFIVNGHWHKGEHKPLG